MNNNNNSNNANREANQVSSSCEDEIDAGSRSSGSDPEDRSGSYGDSDDRGDGGSNGSEASYPNFPLLHSMLKHEKIRTRFLDEEGIIQSSCPMSTSGWIRTLFIGRARALDHVYFPWTIAVINATIFSVLDNTVFESDYGDSSEDWASLFTFALNATLGFLLVFRLNRAAVRFWVAREKWGNIVAELRNSVSSLLVHGNHDLANRDEAIRWLAAFPLASKDFIRGEAHYAYKGYAGILSKAQLERMQRNNKHPPLFVAYQIRQHAQAIFKISAVDANSVSMALGRSQQMNLLETLINNLVKEMGGLERIKGTPLPIVYVSHLRTFLMINLLLLPYIWGRSWGLYTIPIVAVAAFAYLGLEAAAAEVEAPFQKERHNALDMDRYCCAVLSNIQQLLMNWADSSTNRKIGVSLDSNGTVVS
mmetsp:Transcript_19556/g.25231  ORF Transcript_19556/g.25231 Transcript_19556/m.25231 type:complete len:420 (+) Transcript_19556:69-1328(+)